ncbi:Prefoldin subunit 6 [Dispira simplex]|nr:Prefoldin subunit 6 [Dispira simplex]
MSLEAKLEAAGKEFQTIQHDLNKTVQQRQKLESQLQENEMVQKEFKNLNDDANVYKLIGPVLVKQEPTEAKSNVSKRIEYISAEM